MKMKHKTYIYVRDVSEIQYITFGNGEMVLIHVKDKNSNELELHAPLAFWIEAARGARQVEAARLPGKTTKG